MTPPRRRRAHSRDATSDWSALRAPGRGLAAGGAGAGRGHPRGCGCARRLSGIRPEAAGSGFRDAASSAVPPAASPGRCLPPAWGRVLRPGRRGHRARDHERGLHRRGPAGLCAGAGLHGRGHPVGSQDHRQLPGHGAAHGVRAQEAGGEPDPEQQGDGEAQRRAVPGREAAHHPLHPGRDRRGRAGPAHRGVLCRRRHHQLGGEEADGLPAGAQGDPLHDQHARGGAGGRHGVRHGHPRAGGGWAAAGAAHEQRGLLHGGGGGPDRRRHGAQRQRAGLRVHGPRRAGRRRGEDGPPAAPGPPAGGPGLAGRCQDAAGLGAAPRPAQGQRLLPRWRHHPRPALPGERGLPLAAHQCGRGLLHPHTRAAVHGRPGEGLPCRPQEDPPGQSEAGVPDSVHADPLQLLGGPHSKPGPGRQEGLR